MHVVFRESHGLEETETPTDLGQSPWYDNLARGTGGNAAVDPLTDIGFTATRSGRGEADWQITQTSGRDWADLGNYANPRINDDARARSLQVALLVPLNALVAMVRPEKGARYRMAYVWLALLGAETLLLYWLADLPRPAALDAWALRSPPTPFLARLAFAAAFAAAVWRAWPEHTPLQVGNAGALAAFFIAAEWGDEVRVFSAFMAAGGAILVVSLLQESHALAFRDQLTGLPGRRALEERGQAYALAVKHAPLGLVKRQLLKFGGKLAKVVEHRHDVVVERIDQGVAEQVRRPIHKPGIPLDSLRHVVYRKQRHPMHGDDGALSDEKREAGSLHKVLLGRVVNSMDDDEDMVPVVIDLRRLVAGVHAVVHRQRVKAHPVDQEITGALIRLVDIQPQQAFRVAAALRHSISRQVLLDLAVAVQIKGPNFQRCALLYTGHSW